jgi:hypothetical protein
MKIGDLILCKHPSSPYANSGVVLKVEQAYKTNPEFLHVTALWDDGLIESTTIKDYEVIS